MIQLTKVCFISICLFFIEQSAIAQKFIINDGEYNLIDSLKNPTVSVHNGKLSVTFASSHIFGRLTYKYRIKHNKDNSVTLLLINKKMIPSGIKAKRLPVKHSANEENPNYEGDYIVTSDVTGTVTLINSNRTIIFTRNE